MALRKYRMETRHWGACSVLYAVSRAGESVLNLISACQSDDWEGIFVALETSSNIYLRIISLNHPHIQLVTPMWPPIPLQPRILHNHPHPITIYTPQPSTSLQPHTTQNHTHSKNTHTPKPPTSIQLPRPSITHLNYTYPPITHIPSNHAYFSTTHTWCQSILHKWPTNDYTGTRLVLPIYMKSINIQKLCCGQIKCSVHLPVHWSHSWAGGQDVEAAQLNGRNKDGAALITTTPHIACIHVVQQYLNIFPQASKSSERCEYYLLYKNCFVRSRENVLKLRHFIELHYVGTVHLL